MIEGMAFTPSVQVVAFVLLGLIGMWLNLWLRGKTLESIERTRSFYADFPPRRVDEYRQNLSLLTEGLYQSRKYALFTFCQACFTVLGLLALWYPARVPRSPYDALYSILGAALVLAAELALDLVSVLAWRKTGALEELAGLDFMPSPAPGGQATYHQHDAADADKEPTDATR
jgi:hypothetical protein